MSKIFGDSDRAITAGVRPWLQWCHNRHNTSVGQTPDKEVRIKHITIFAEGIPLCYCYHSIKYIYYRLTQLIILYIITHMGGLVVSMLASGTQDRGFDPGRSRRKKSTACLP